MAIAEAMHYEGKEVNDKSFRTGAPGTYRVCLDNTMSRFTPKWVQLHVDGPSSHAEWTTLQGGVASAQAAGTNGAESAVTKDDLSPVERTVERIEQALSSIADLQHTYRWHEVANRQTAEITYTRVVWYSILVCVVAGVMTLGQFYVLTRWFRR